MTVLYTTVASPLGDLLLTGDGRALTGLYLDPHSRRPATGTGWRRNDVAFSAVVGQLDAYFAGRLRRFDLPLAPTGSPFQLTVWSALRDIPYGSTVSYGELARRVGKPGAARAVGLANGRNPVSIIVPCHRVIGADGTLTGYGGGLERKRQLLDLERGAALPLVFEVHQPA